ncbi:cytidine deaminase [Candidatus Wolfebacteria bacterium]|nr:cytidine deaminase [Candidatus Wolfebacteria bacterium]
MNKKKGFERSGWDEIFMFQAISCATRHSCLKRGVGAVLVKEKRIIGTGYNGAASGITSCRDLGHCYYEQLAFSEKSANGGNLEDIKERFKIFCQAVHAEMNALSQCSRNDTKGSVLYITNYPCPKCVQDGIITNGIKEVKIWKEYLQNFTLTIDEKRASERKLLEAGISVNYITLSKERIREIALYMADVVGERTDYKFKGGE